MSGAQLREELSRKPTAVQMPVAGKMRYGVYSKTVQEPQFNILAIPSAAENFMLFLKKLFKILASHCDPRACNLETANNYATNMSIMN